MRSVFLEGIPSERSALDALAAEFPGQSGETKVVFDPSGQYSIGYMYAGEPENSDDQLGPYLIQADYSGGEWDFNAKQLVVEAVRRIQARVGGEFRDYGD